MQGVLERGDISFVYRPRVGEHDPRGVADVQRLYAILCPGSRRWHDARVAVHPEIGLDTQPPA